MLILMLILTPLLTLVTPPLIQGASCVMFF